MFSRDFILPEVMMMVWKEAASGGEAGSSYSFSRQIKTLNHMEKMSLWTAILAYLVS